MMLFLEQGFQLQLSLQGFQFQLSVDWEAKASETKIVSLRSMERVVQLAVPRTIEQALHWIWTLGL